MQQLGKEVLVFPCADVEPFSLAGQLGGMKDWLMDIALGDKPELIHRLLHFCTR
jgi:hypothetical protein